MKEKPVKLQLLGTLEGLGKEDFNTVKWYLEDPELLDGHPAIKKCYLEAADILKTTDLMVGTYTEKKVMEVMTLILHKMKEGE